MAPHCLVTLVNMRHADPAGHSAHDRRAMDHALACDPKIKCYHRLECSALTYYLAQRHHPFSSPRTSDEMGALPVVA